MLCRKWRSNPYTQALLIRNAFLEDLVRPLMPSSSSPSTCTQRRIIEDPLHPIQLSEELEKVCNSHGIKTAFKPLKSLRQTLMEVKTLKPEEKKKGVMYEVPCKDCRKTYIGGTKRMLKVRFGEHKQAVKRGDSKSRIAVHAYNTQHAIDWIRAK